MAAHTLRTGDPYGGRRASDRSPEVTFQLDYAEEAPLYLGLNRSDLQRYTEVLRRCLALLGARSGDTIAFYDYGTSPATYLASAAYVPYLHTGAADALGCTVICNDGVPNMAQRAVDILKLVRPRFMLVRTECLQPLLGACEADGLVVARHVQAVIATHNEARLEPRLRDRFQQRLGVPLYELARSDLALFMAMQCPDCRCFHTWPDLHQIELVSPESGLPVHEGQPGRLVVTPRFPRLLTSWRVLTNLEARRLEAGCPRGPEDPRLCP